MLLQCIFLASATLFYPVAAISGMATTTRYLDNQEGACGCGQQGGAMFPWQQGIGPGITTAAGSQALYDPSGSAWCGTECGLCYELTSTGVAPSGQGMGGEKDMKVTVMVTNLCPFKGNEQWCPDPGTKNQHGYKYHFDIMASNSSVAPIIGDNPIVNFRSVPCPAAAASNFDQCLCKLGGGVSGTNSSSLPPTSQPTSTPPAFSNYSTSTGNSSSDSQPASPSGPVLIWGQCGGKGYTGSTTCQSPQTCQIQNPWYSQCL